MMPKVSIILLNWNGSKDTLECVNSLKRISYKNNEIIIVDNNSNESGKKILRELLYVENVSIFYNECNMGFTGGNNLGIKHALASNSDFILLLNNDTIVKENFLEPLVESFYKEQNLGIVAPQINYYCEKDSIWSAGGYISKVRGSGITYSNWYQKVRNRDYRPVGFVSGCCMLIKKEVLEEIGTFDENFFLYLEDTDLCFRTSQAGYKIVVSYKSLIYHKVGNSTSNKKLAKLPLYYVTRNRLYFSKKVLGKWHYMVKYYLYLTMQLKFLIWFVKRQTENIRVVKKAFEDFNNNKFGKADNL